MEEVVLAGLPGFEPGHDGVKVRCLTAWLQPINWFVHLVCPPRPVLCKLPEFCVPQRVEIVLRCYKLIFRKLIIRCTTQAKRCG